MKSLAVENRPQGFFGQKQKAGQGSARDETAGALAAAVAEDAGVPIPTGQNKAVIPTANAVGTTGGDTGKRGILGEGTSGFVDNIPKGTLSNTEAPMVSFARKKRLQNKLTEVCPYKNRQNRHLILEINIGQGQES